jgi:hypothetical protein
VLLFYVKWLIISSYLASAIFPSIMWNRPTNVRRFIYTDKPPKTMDDSQKLLKVANRFACSGLQHIAENEIVKAGTDAKNAAELLMFADRTLVPYSEKLLWSSVLRILSQYGIQKDGISSTSLRRFWPNLLVPLTRNFQTMASVLQCESQSSAKSWTSRTWK